MKKLSTLLLLAIMGLSMVSCDDESSTALSDEDAKQLRGFIKSAVVYAEDEWNTANNKSANWTKDATLTCEWNSKELIRTVTFSNYKYTYKGTEMTIETGNYKHYDYYKDTSDFEDIYNLVIVKADGTSHIVYRKESDEKTIIDDVSYYDSQL